jgi:hypothetical protein
MLPARRRETRGLPEFRQHREKLVLVEHRLRDLDINPSLAFFLPHTVTTTEKP